MAVSSPSRRAIVFLKIAVTVLLCYLIAKNIDTHELLATTRDVDLVFLLLPCLLYPVALAGMAVKLKWLLNGYGMPIGMGAALEVNWIAGFFNNFLPTSVGGDVYRLIALNRRYPNKPAQVVSVIVIDRGLGLMALLVIAAITGGLFLQGFALSTWLIVALYVVAACLTLTGFLLLFVRHELRIRFTTGSTLVNRVINGVNVLVSFPDKGAITRGLLVSWLLFALTVVSNLFLFAAFAKRVDPLLLFFVIAVVSLAAMVPISINSIGVTEGVGIFLFSHFGYAPELVLSIFLIGRILMILCSATGGLGFMLRRSETGIRDD